jgi:hypothetical protein
MDLYLVLKTWRLGIILLLLLALDHPNPKKIKILDLVLKP